MWASFSVVLQFVNSVVFCRLRFVQQVEGIKDHTTAMFRVLCEALSFQDLVCRGE